MSSSRGRANHSLYLAKILLSAWGREAGRESLPERLLCQAYLPAIRLHLLDAYGWFLLDVVGAAELPQQPPHSCDELPPPPTGKAEPAEIREFRLLENEGWLADLIRGAGEVVAIPARSPGNLAVGADFPDIGQVEAWLDRLGTCFERMGDSLDEC
jgi:hypothetical protein